MKISILVVVMMLLGWLSNWLLAVKKARASA
jgi:hypothetical protein